MARQPTFTTALTRALAGLDQAATDGAAVRLAYRYCAELDRPDADLVKVGPALLAVLESLGMTPRARAAAGGKGGPTSEPAASPLDQLRQRRAARANRTAAMDPTAP